MISNPGFSFSNVSGKHSIETDFSASDPLFAEVIICNAPKSIIPVYSHHQSSSLKSKSVALQFVKLDIKDNQAILDFCDKYGLTNSIRSFKNPHNEYLFQKLNKTDFMKRIPLAHSERCYLTNLKKEIVSMRLLLELSSAIENKDYDSIVRIIAFFASI